MKGFLKSKLVMTIAAFLMIAAAVAVPLLSGSITHSHAAPARKQLFILLQGITSSLDQAQINANKKPGFGQPGGIASTIRGLFPHASILSYSYNGVNSKGQLKPYVCADTTIPSLADEITSLSNEIALNSDSNTDVYLVGHSLGGAVAFGYAAELLANPKLLPTGAALKAVITLDAPLGGTQPSLTYATIETLYLVLFSAFIKHDLNCLTFPHLALTPASLTAIFKTASSTPAPEDSPPPDPQGAQANILENTTLSNENIAEQLQAAGTSFLSIGATNDFLWNPKPCIATAPDFTNTQFLEDEGDNNGLYGRSFVAMSNGKPLTCHPISSDVFSCIKAFNPLDPFSFVEGAKEIACIVAEGTKFFTGIGTTGDDINSSHQAVLTDPSVVMAIKSFLSGLPTGTFSALTPVPAVDVG